MARSGFRPSWSTNQAHVLLRQFKIIHPSETSPAVDTNTKDPPVRKRKVRELAGSSTTSRLCKKPRVQTHDECSPLLRLPGEIRELIYGHLVGGSELRLYHANRADDLRNVPRELEKLDAILAEALQPFEDNPQKFDRPEEAKDFWRRRYTSHARGPLLEKEILNRLMLEPLAILAVNLQLLREVTNYLHRHTKVHIVVSNVDRFTAREEELLRRARRIRMTCTAVSSWTWGRRFHWPTQLRQALRYRTDLQSLEFHGKVGTISARSHDLGAPFPSQIIRTLKALPVITKSDCKVSISWDGDETLRAKDGVWAHDYLELVARLQDGQVGNANVPGRRIMARAGEKCSRGS